ncbi:hypothetical protein ACS386_09280 [Flavobacteriaceae bacterium LMO-SS05]
MRNFKLAIGFIFLSLLCINKTFGQSNPSKQDWDNLIIGKWVSKINKTSDGKEYHGIKCKGTIQYFQNGNYALQDCDWNETGKWKFSKNKDLIIYYDIDNEYWKKELDIDDLGERHEKILSITQTELINITNSEDVGEIQCFYTRIE